MGGSPSKEELLYQEVQRGNHDAVKAYRRDGASLEWVDKEGRTPLILACTRHELLDMAITLLNLGANVNAYRPGTHGGFPLHHAVKKGLTKTVTLLLSHGADPFAVNDDGRTPLEVARSRGHTSVVRLLEEHVSIFNGMLRELYGPRILESLAPNLCTKKIWATVIPVHSPGSRAPKYELAIYTSPKISVWNGIRQSTSTHPAGLCNVAHPRTIIQLSQVEVKELNYTSADPILYILDKSKKMKYKFLSEKEGDKAELERFHKACKGIPQIQYGHMPANSIAVALPSPAYFHDNHCQVQRAPMQYANRACSPAGIFELHHNLAAANVSSPCKSTTSTTIPLSDDTDLVLALNASISSAMEEGVPISPASSHVSFTNFVWQDDLERTYNMWGSSDPKIWTKNVGYEQWGELDNDFSTQLINWGSAEAEASTSSSYCSEGQQSDAMLLAQSDDKLNDLSINQVTFEIPLSSPLFSRNTAGDDALSYFFSTSAELKSSTGSDKAETKNMSGLCVVCWDAPIEGVCIPCGHLASCMACLSEINTKNWGCPVCRAQIQQIVKVYAV